MVERGQLFLELQELFSFLYNEVSLAVLLVRILPQGLPVSFEHFHGHFSRDALTAVLIIIIIFFCFVITEDL